MVWGAALLLGLCAEQSCARRQRDWCPETCGTLGNVPGNWNVYRSVEPLSRCNQTMLVSFNVFNDLNKDDTTVHIGACTANVTNHSLTGRYASSHSSKSTLRSRTGLSRSIYENVTDAANSTTPTWATNTTEVVNIEVLSAGTNGSHSASDIVSAATALQQMLTMDSQATEKTLLVAYSNGATVGVYAGERIGNDGTNDLLQKLIDTTNHGDTAETVVMQVCGKQRNAREILGLVANTGTTNVDLGTIQNALASWSTAKCATLDNSLQSSESITLYQTPLVAAVQARGTPTELVARATCSAIQVVSGDSCSSLATECGISGDVFTEYNSASDECSTLAVGEWVCCSAGTLPDLSPSAYDNGTCYTYYVQSGDSCSALAASYSLTIDDIETYNENTWGWMGCDDLLADMNICLSAGDGPMPASMANAECGPQVPGTDYPTNSASLALLNPCPLNACCDIWVRYTFILGLQTY